ncbi:hypothetical protein [Actinopolymorpha pittospori]
MAGEELHERGAEGARRAKVWLERTTRAEARWVTPDRVAVPKLTFPWASGAKDAKDFSFDLGGLLRGGSLEGQQFFVESKFYTSPGNQGTMFREFLAKCYSAYKARPEICDHFFWITWAPFLVSHWSKLDKPEYVRSAIIENRERALGVEDETDAELKIDGPDVEEVAKRLWIIVLSEKQEQQLVMSSDHLGIIRRYEISGSV